jgi:hypothetical protein
MTVKSITLSNEAAIAIEVSWEMRQTALAPIVAKFNARLLEILAPHGVRVLPEKFNLALVNNDGTPIRPMVFQYEEPDPVVAPVAVASAPEPVKEPKKSKK